MFFEVAILKDFAKFTRKHLCQSLIFNKIAGLRPATLLKKKLWHRYFPVNFSIFLRTPFYGTPLAPMELLLTTLTYLFSGIEFVFLT